MSEDRRPPGILLIANSDCRRAELFQAAVAGAGLPPPRRVDWLDLFREAGRLSEQIQPGDCVRIESPGRNWDTERALLARGADLPDDERYPRIPAPAALELVEDSGRISYPRQWYRGFRSLLAQIRDELFTAPPHTLVQHPADIAEMFDKPACHARLSAAGVPVARSLGTPRTYEELLQSMDQFRQRRVFVKLAHGSSASGVVAYQTDGKRHQATTTVEMEDGPDGTLLYNSRRIRTYREQREIAVLLDALCRHGVHAESWLPKGAISGQTFDLRVLIIAGRVRHLVARLSRSPMTNLHLLNQRGDPAKVQKRMGPAAWDAMEQSCRLAASLYPASLHVGLDVRVSPDFRRHSVLEANAFGDLLPGVLCEGRDTYSDELAALREQEELAGRRGAA